MRPAMAQRAWKGALIVARSESRERARRCRSSGHSCGRLRASETGRDAPLSARARALAALRGAGGGARRGAAAVRGPGVRGVRALRHPGAWAGASGVRSVRARHRLRVFVQTSRILPLVPWSSDVGCRGALGGGGPAGGADPPVGLLAPVERALRARVRPSAVRRRARRVRRRAHAVAALARQAQARPLERRGRPRRRGHVHPAGRQRAEDQRPLSHDRVGRRVRPRCRGRARVSRVARAERGGGRAGRACGRTRGSYGCSRGMAVRSRVWRTHPTHCGTKSPRSRRATRPRRRTCSSWAAPRARGRASSFVPCASSPHPPSPWPRSRG